MIAIFLHYACIYFSQTCLLSNLLLKGLFVSASVDFELTVNHVQWSIIFMGEGFQDS